MRALPVLGPAWWCATCQAWWPGAWRPPDPGGPYVTAAEAVEWVSAPAELRTCPECGTRLERALRPLGVAYAPDRDREDG